MKKLLSVVLVLSMVLVLFVVRPVSVSAEGFKDVPADYWAKGQIDYLVSKGIVIGYPDGTFKPETPVTREQFATIICIAKGIKEYKPATATFKDVNSSRWSYGFVEAAVKAGYVKGVTAATFAPVAPLKRQDLAVLLIHVTGKEQVAASAPVKAVFSNDESKVGAYALAALAYAVSPAAQLLVWDTNRNINPVSPATRADCAYGTYMALFPPKQGGNLSMAITQNPDSLFIPLLTLMTASWTVTAGMQDSLIMQSPNGALYPSMAREVPSVANGLWKVNDAAGTMTVTFRLRPGLKWSDGIAVTSHDFKFSWEMVENDKISVISRYVEDMISNIDDSDPTKVIVYYKKLYPLANYGLYNLYPAHLLEAVYKNNPADINSSSFNEKPIYCGPYMLDTWEQNNYIRLKANPLYFAGRPNFDTVTFWVIPDSNTILANYMAGKLDVSVPGMGIDDPDQANILRERAGSMYFVQYIPSAYIEHLEVNMDVSQAGQDMRVRQALQIAIDRDELNRRVFRGFRIPAYNIVPINNPFELKTGLDPYAYNSTKANELLDDAGYKKGPDGIRLDPKGNKLHFVISTTTSSVRAREFPVIQAYWKAIGVETEFKPMASNKLFGDILPKGEYDMGMVSTSDDPGQPVAYSRWHSSQIPTEANGWVGTNRFRFKNAALDKAMTTTVTNVDNAKRTAAFYDAQRIINEEVPWILLTWETEVRVEHKTIGGIDYPADNGTTLYTWNLRYWWRK